ncbi:MAG: histidinol-phosphate transaminase [Planctomycetota bacterium]|nr:MAG: histidinol-phosphate transaminase [Planctomycetota bacterium]REK24159.1 MAG: histidinol-phosphate transaminase [Planctomycetota bacterium]REK38399.1 MAG: histidinol-phosphate transaminase [Planctomycetota bacterium]
MRLFRPDVDRLTAYTPGEQPQESGWVKLNTNENPYPPSPRVLEAIERVASSRLHVYPDPVGTSFRKAAAELLNVEPDWILPANGSDENLTLLLRTFADPGELVCAPYPSYILYETLAAIQGAAFSRILLNPDWSWPLPACREQIENCKLLFIPNPNSPSGTFWDQETVTGLVPPRGVLVLDEAYGDFADRSDAIKILSSDVGGRVVVTRSFSKSYSLAGLRFGYAVAHPDLIRGMRKVKDSYNCDALSLAGAEAALHDQDWMLANREKIIATRGRLATALEDLGFDVTPSQANFVWTTHAERDHKQLYEQLKAGRILVRYMQFPDCIGETTIDGLRISIGRNEEIDQLLTALNTLV